MYHIGAFYQPQAVYINLDTLNTLPDREYFSGFGEIIKHALIKDSDYFTYLYNNYNAALSRDMAIVEEIIYRSCQIKQQVVEHDPTEQGERALLNFGHTIGHAIEKEMNFSLLHGECVAIGALSAALLSKQHGFITEGQLNDIIELFSLYQLNTMVQVDANAILSHVKHDKKMDAGSIKFILLKSIGTAFIDKTLSDKELFDAISFIMNEREEK